MIKNPYFDTEQEQELQQYPVKEVAGAPSTEPEKGFTSIIIPIFLNSYPVFHYTGHCIGSIREHTDKEKTPYEIILVQNGGRESGQVVEEFTDQTFANTYCDKVIPNRTNLGYAKAVNQGIRCARGEYIAIINNDVCVFNHWLSDMQECLQNGLDLVMATPMYGMPFARAVESNLLREKTLGKSIVETFDGFRDFSCVLTKKEVFAKVGVFNEDFFMYGEDLDLMRRIEKDGGKLASTKRVRTFHISGGTSSGIEKTPDIMNESKAKLKEIWGY